MIKTNCNILNGAEDSTDFLAISLSNLPSLITMQLNILLSKAPKKLVNTVLLMYQQVYNSG